MNKEKQISETDKAINKDLILREKLALQRTVLANQTTLLSFIRTSLYFLVAGLSLKSLLKLDNAITLSVALFIVSFVILVFGVFNFYRHKHAIKNSEKHIGAYQMDYIYSEKHDKL